jgi:FAD/FMN-containing dehydrogenase
MVQKTFTYGALAMRRIIAFTFSAFAIINSINAAPSTRLVNDVQSQLNLTEVNRIEIPKSVGDIQTIIRNAKKENLAVSIAGGRHAMGGQQFGKGTILIDMSSMNRVLKFDSKEGIVEVQTGIQWPELIHQLIDMQKGNWPQWGITQKQTGADRLSIGGAISANVHGRGLKFKPFIQDVESFVLVDANGEKKVCSRKENSELFRLATGGYGLFGVIATAKIRLSPRTKIERVVEVIDLKNLMSRFDERIQQGFVYGDFQYKTDRDADDFLKRGVFSCYRPVDSKTPIKDEQKELSERDWRDLYYLAHSDRKKVFEKYSSYYLSTNGQIYWSDIHQLSVYVDDYHKEVSDRSGEKEKATEMITEIYVPRPRLTDFMEEAAQYLKEKKVDIIYGTVRLIEQDDESFLAWAKQPYVCVIFNLHVVHTPEGLSKASSDFRGLIDMAIKRQGSYYLTYHRFASKDQMLACYPQFPQFLRLKRKFDPEERFQSEWYRFYREMFAQEINETK